MSDRLLDTVVHPTAALFPLIDGPAFDELVEDIRQHGQLIPVVRHEGKLIDGRNRWRACRVAGIEPVEIDWKPVPGVTVSEWIISTNAVRRHMTVDQINVCTAEAMKYVREERAAARAKTQFKPGVSPNPGGKPKAEADTISYPPEEKPDTKEKNARSTVGQVAAAANVSHHKAAQAVALVTAAEKSPEAAEALEKVKAGTVKLKDAVAKVKRDTHPNTGNSFSPEAIAAGEAAAKDSEKLWSFKGHWKKLSKPDRAAFVEWARPRTKDELAAALAIEPTVATDPDAALRHAAVIVGCIDPASAVSVENVQTLRNDVDALLKKVWQRRSRDARKTREATP